MKKRFLLPIYAVLLMIITTQLSAQISISSDGTPPDNSAMLDVMSTTKGLLAPRMTLVQRNAITIPAKGLMIFQTDGVPGLYNNSGTPANPFWLLLGNNTSQWLNDGTSIYYNLGKVGIGTISPAANFHVEENGPGFTGSFGTPVNAWTSGTNVAIGNDNADAVLYVGQSALNKGFLLWRYHATFSDAFFSVGIYDGLNNLILQEIGGKVGVRTTSPAALFHVAEESPGLTTVFGRPINNWVSSTNVSIGDDNGPAVMYIGQGEANTGLLSWQYNSTPSNAYFNIATYNGSNPLVLQGDAAAGGKVGIGITSPGSLLDVHYDANTYNLLGYSNYYGSYFHHNELEADGDGQAALYAYRNRPEPAANNGTGYGVNTSNMALKGYSYWGDQYSFGTAGFNYNDFTRCGGILGANQTGFYWGSLGYNNSGSTGYGGYFSSFTSGGGKGRQAYTGIGIGAWGDLLGADIHGKIYGIYAEGENYAMFSNGPVYKNDLDVHLQENGTGMSTVLYTNVSTDVTVQTSGYATLSSGKTNIAFDPSFTASVSSETPVVVTVTPMGNSNGVYLSEVSKSGFSVVENNDGKSSVTVSYIAIGKRAGYENPVLSREVIDAGYTQNLSRGLHNDADTKTNGEGLYYENGKLVVGIHASSLPDPNKPDGESIIPNPTKTQKRVLENKSNGSGSGEPDQASQQPPVPANPSAVDSPSGGTLKIQPAQPPKSRIENSEDSPARSKQPPKVSGKQDAQGDK
jgi:hypothetical protein